MGQKPIWFKASILWGSVWLAKQTLLDTLRQCIDRASNSNAVAKRCKIKALRHKDEVLFLCCQAVANVRFFSISLYSSCQNFGILTINADVV